ncbi:uncharacterized protein CDAR_619901 [Caerostris darwini]|uniref:Gustatory receptor n=1 Tax=Caerostris darwini TaxID=1538125 RepID=A0AAV4VE67_9ARAC|nr:uncharacterized protein CDAR_619901 [Caerostris darwini]
MNHSKNWIQDAFFLIFLLFHLEGLETVPCPDFLSRRHFLKVMWNFPKFLVPIFICVNLVTEIMWLCFISISRDELVGLMIQCLQMWICISVFQSRSKIRLLTEDLYRISNMLHAYTLQEKKMMKIHIWMYCLFVILGTVFLEVMFSRSRFLAYEELEGLLDPKINSRHLKERFADFLCFTYGFSILLVNGYCAILPGYYCFACNCMKQFFLRFEMKSKVLIARHDYHRILEIFKKMNETMIRMDDLLSLPILVSIINILATLFWFGYSFTFLPNDNNLFGIFIYTGFVQYFVLLMMILPPAAAANQAAAMAREIILSLANWFPKRHSIIKSLVCRKFLPKTALTLGKMYRIDKSMLISAIATLISYGIVLGTLGSVQSSDDEN